MTEQYIVSITHRKGKRAAQRHHLQVPLDLAIGRLERLSDLAIREAIKDLIAEQSRRDGTPIAEPAPTPEPAPEPTPYDPFASQIRGGS